MNISTSLKFCLKFQMISTHSALMSQPGLFYSLIKIKLDTFERFQELIWIVVDFKGIFTQGSCQGQRRPSPRASVQGGTHVLS